MTSPVVAVASPAAVGIEWPATVVPVMLDSLADADQFLRTGAVTAALACDAVVAVIPATVGCDPLTAAVWQSAADAGAPRAVLITQLGDGHADFADLAAIARRVLGDECVVTDLPVFDDDGSVVAGMSVVDGRLHGSFGERESDREHRRLTSDARYDLLAALASTCDDDAAAAALIARLDGADPDDPDADVGLWQADDGGVWRVDGLLHAAWASGQVAPVVPDIPGDAEALVRLMARWQGLERRSALLPCDAAGDYVDGGVAVVVAAQADSALLRVVNGALEPERDWYVMSRTGFGRDGHLAPYRMWPVSLWDIGPMEPNRLMHTRVSLTPHVGDVIANGPLWVLPASY